MQENKTEVMLNEEAKNNSKKSEKKQKAAEKPKLPKTPKEWKELIGGLFYRLFYVILLVWETKPIILISMIFMSILNGVLPILSAFISAELINALVRGVKGEGGGFSAVIGLLVLQFGYIIFSSLLKNLNSAINRISNELVANHIKTKIINKAKTLDLRNFDDAVLLKIVIMMGKSLSANNRLE